jgi:hypothetical protein
MEAQTGTTSFGFQAEWPKLFVEGRWLEEPVKLSYPTYWSAAEASGFSRMLGGIHWSVDNENGLASGKQVGQKVWDEAQQYFSGNARPMWQAGLQLSAPVWQYSSTKSPDGVTLQSAKGLQIGFTASQSENMAGWQTIKFDPPPAGKYRLHGTAHVTTDDKGSVLVALRSVDADQPERILAEASWTSEGQSDDVKPIMAEFTSDGKTPVRFTFEAANKGETASSVALERLMIEYVDPYRDNRSQ